MEDESADYLQVPITEQERVQARQRSRSTSIERLLPDSESVYSQGFDDSRSYTNSSGPSRYQSVRGNVVDAPRRFHSYQGGQYAAVSPIDEEDFADTASEVPSRPRTIPQSEKSFEPLVPLPDLWTPVWLRRSTIAAFIAFFVMSIIALVVLWVLSATHNGFEIHFTGPHHEYWVYFPTILVIFLVGLWRQVDYHTKSLTPWDELQNGPISPSKSLLLDHVSPLQIVALFQAFIHNHIPIVATVSAFVFFKIITIFSTGLFILNPKNVSQSNFPLLMTARFDAGNVGDLSSINSSPVTAFYGIAYQGIPQTAGVQSHLAYLPFRYDESRNEKLAANGTFSANMDAFVPTITCRAVDGKLDGDATKTQSPEGDVYGDGIRFTIPNDDICKNYPAIVVSALNPELQPAPTTQTYGSVKALACGSDAPVSLLFSLLDLSFEQDLRDGFTQLAMARDQIALSSSRTVNNMRNVLCQASHTMTTVKVSNNTRTLDTPSQGLAVETVTSAQNKTLPNLSDGALMTVFQTLTSVSGGVFGETIGADSTSGFFTLLARHLGSKDVTRLHNTNDFLAAIDTTFKGVMSQFAHQSLSQAANDDISGQVVRRETRYVVNEASAAVMVAALIVGVVAGAILLFRAPRGVVDRNPGPIAASAAVLTNSAEMNRLLRRGGIPSENNSERAVDGYEFGTAIATTEHGQASFKIVTSEGVRDHNAPSPDDTLTWWHPITASIFFVIFTAALPILCIGLLEFVQSKNASGIVEVPDNLATDVYTHYIPSLVMVIIASMVNLVDFNVAVFTPWSALAKGAATHKKSILAYYLGMTPLETAFRALRVGHFNVVVSTLATIIASILAIVAAGLYNGKSFTTEAPAIGIVTSGGFNLEWSNSALSDNGAAGILSSVLHNNLSYPSFTNRNLVFPTLILENGDLSSTNESVRDTNSSTTKIETDALQPHLSCYLVDPNFMSQTAGPDNVVLNIQASLPDSCQIAGVSGEQNFISFDTEFPLPVEGSIIGGRQFDLLFGEGSSLVNNVLSGEAQQNFSSLIGDTPAVGCPSLVFIYGSFSASTALDDDSSAITAMLCTQEIRSVRSSFHIISNSTIIDTSQPVTTDTSDSSLLVNPLAVANGTTSADDADKAFNFRIQSNLLRGFRPFTDVTSNSGLSLDPFFQGLLHTGSTPNDPDTLLGGSEDSQAALLRSIVNFYGLYMAQALSLNMRSTSNTSTLTTRQTSTPLGTIPTTLTTIRLVQDPTTKLILQLLLALTSLLTLLAWSLTKFHRVLPLPPFSIANSMSLLAGSDLAHSDEAAEGDGLCECCGKPRSREHIAEAEAEADLRGRPTSSRSTNDTMRLSVPQGVEFDRRTSSPRGVREGVVPVGAEWWGADAGSHGPRGKVLNVVSTNRRQGKRAEQGRWEVVFAGRRYSMGWWKEDVNRGRMRRRWGVDVGERPDGGLGIEGEDWMLGKRRLRNSGDGGVGVQLHGMGAGSSDRSSLANWEEPGGTHPQQLGVERAYDGAGYGQQQSQQQQVQQVRYDQQGQGQTLDPDQHLRPRPSSDLGYSANREHFLPPPAAPPTTTQPSVAAYTPYTYTYNPAPIQHQGMHEAPTNHPPPWSFARRVAAAEQNVTPEMRLEQQQHELVSPIMGRGSRALDVPATPGLFGGEDEGYGEGGIREEEGIANSERGGDSEQEWERSEAGDDGGDGNGRAMNFSRGGYERVEGGGEA